MFGLGLGEILLIAVVGLVVIGPERMPHAMRRIARFIASLRKTADSVRDEIDKVYDQALRPMSESVEESISKELTETPAPAPGTHDETDTNNGSSEKIG